MEPAVACSLSTGQLAGRTERWRHLAERALIDHRTTGDGVRLRFVARAGVADKLAELAQLERECCGFARWQVRAAGDEVTLSVSASGEGVAVVREMFAALSDPAPGAIGRLEHPYVQDRPIVR